MSRADNILSCIDELVINAISKTSIEEIWGEILPQIKQKIVDEFGFIPEVHRVETPERTSSFTGITHEKFNDVLGLVNADIPVYMAGPAGAGKNVIAKQVADGLGLDFYFTNAVTQEFKLTGFIDANGHYQETQFYKAFKNGGLFFLDELDASIPEVLIILNAAIANRYFDFPNGKIEAHPNFRVIAAGNTVGTGADSSYTGRFCLDAASLDRYALIDIDYSSKIEESVTNNNTELMNFAHEFRKICNNSGIQCLFSYRSLGRISQLEKIIKSLPEVLKISLTKGLQKDDLNILYNELNKVLSSNKYVKALSEIA